MNSWDTSDEGRDARSDATIAFCMFLKDLKQSDRDLYTCPKPDAAQETIASNNAKQKFAELGGFYLQGAADIPSGVKPIPEKVTFRVYEFEPFDKRDDIVTFVLPKPGSGPRELPSYYYRCSYWPY